MCSDGYDQSGSGRYTCDGSSGSAVCTCAAGWALPTCGTCSHECPAAAPAAHAAGPCPAGQCLGAPPCAATATIRVGRAGTRATKVVRGPREASSAPRGGALLAHRRRTRRAAPRAFSQGPLAQPNARQDTYEGEGAAQYTCESTGHWGGGGLVCTGRPCLGAPVAGGDLHVSEVHSGAAGHFPSTLTFSCAHSNERVGGDTIWVCSNTTLQYEPSTNPSATAHDVQCSQCPALTSGHCPGEQLRCPIHLEPAKCCSSWCMPWDHRCHAVQMPSTCRLLSGESNRVRCRAVPAHPCFRRDGACCVHSGRSQTSGRSAL